MKEILKVDLKIVKFSFFTSEKISTGKLEIFIPKILICIKLGLCPALLYAESSLQDDR